MRGSTRQHKMGSVEVASLTSPVSGGEAISIKEGIEMDVVISAVVYG